MTALAANFKDRTAIAAWTREHGVYLALVLLILYNAIATPNFLTVNTAQLLFSQVPPVIIVSLGMALVIGTGGVDLSVGSIMAIASAVLAKFVTGGAPITGAASAITPSSSSDESEAGETGATGESGESETNETSTAGESETDVASATTGASPASGITASAGTMATGVAPFVPHGGQYGFFPTSTTNYAHGKEPEIAARLDALGKALHLHLVGLSGYRTPQHSVAVGGYANDPHTRGEAMDTPGVEAVPESVLRRFGLTRPFPGASEADHIQLA